MARSRNIKPGFFLNEDLAELPYEARLLFIGLWCLADRKGRLENRPKKIKMQLFPADALDIPRALTMLAQCSLITLYTVAPTKYIQVNNFLKHQNPHIKEQASTIPAPDLHGASPADSLNLIPDSLNPDSPLKDAGVETPAELPPRDPCPYGKIVNLYHKILPMCPKVVSITDARKRAMSARWKNGAHGLDFWEDYFNSVSQSLWMTGRKDPSPGRKQFIADIDFLIKEKTVIGTQEGKYHE